FGPNEIHRIGALYPALDQNQLWIYCGEIKKMSLYDFEKKCFIQEYKQKSDDVIATRFAPTYRNTFIGNQADGKNRYAEFSEDGKKIKDYEQLLALRNQNNDIPNSVLSYLNQGYLSINKKLDKIGYGYLFRDVIEVFDLKDSTIMNIYGPYDSEPTFDVE